MTYKSKRRILKNSRSVGKNLFSDYLFTHQFAYCKALQRKVFFDKQPNAILDRKDAKKRLNAFFVAIDILKKEKSYQERINEDCLEYDIRGFDSTDREVVIHLREELDLHRNKKLYFISCY